MRLLICARMFVEGGAMLQPATPTVWVGTYGPSAVRIGCPSLLPSRMLSYSHMLGLQPHTVLEGA